MIYIQFLYTLMFRANKIDRPISLAKKFCTLSLILILLSALACKKRKDLPDLTSTPEKKAPTAFEVSVIDRDEKVAAISWSTSVGEEIRYDIELDGKMIAKDLINLEFEINDLISSKTYTGQVVAHDKNGKRTSALFDLKVLDQQVFMTNATDQKWAKTAFDGSGQIYWKSAAANLACIPAVSGDTLFVGGGTNAMALNRENGHVIWSRSAEVPANLALLCYRGKLVLPGRDKLDILNSATGTIIWTLNLPDYTEPFINKGILYTTANKQVFAYDLVSGAKKWQFTAGGNGSATLVMDGVLYFIGADGNFYALNAADGTLKWKTSFTGTVEVSMHMSSRPSIIGDNVYFLFSDNSYYFYEKNFTVNALNKHSGASIWSRQLGSHFGMSMMPHSKLGLVVSGGRLRLFDPVSGVETPFPYSSDYRFTITDKQIFFTYYLSKTVLCSVNFSKPDFYRGGFVMPNGDGWWKIPVVIKNGKAYYPSECAMNLIE